MPSFNPNSPAALGLEWQPLHEDRTAMVSSSNVFEGLLQSSATETVDQLALYTPTRTGSVPEAYVAEIYEDGDFPTLPLAATEYLPTATAEAAFAQSWDGSTLETDPSTLFDIVNEGSFTPVALPAALGTGMADSSFLYNSDGRDYGVDFQFDGMAAAAAGLHIARVSLVARVQPYAVLGSVASVTITPYLKIAGTLYLGATQTRTNRVSGAHEISQDWFVNPDQLSPWLPGDLDAFDSGVATASAGVYVASTGTPHSAAAVLQVKLLVFDAGTDQRQAVGWLTRDDQLGGLGGWFSLDLQQPDGTPGWGKLATTDYRLSFRRMTSVSSGLQLFPIALVGHDPRTVNGWSRTDTVYDGGSLLARSSSVRDWDRSWAPGIGLVVGAGVSDDSQPYIELDEDVSRLYTGRELRQYFTTPGSLPVTTFAVLQLTLGQEGALADGPVTASIHRQSDDAQVGSSVVLTSAEFLEVPGIRTGYANYRTLPLLLGTPATLATSTQYYVKLVSTASTAAAWRWEVARSLPFPVGADTPPTGIDDAGFGGTVDSFWIDGVFHTDSDAVMTLFTPPDPPTGLTATGNLEDPAECVGVANISWSGTALGGDFSRYEIQRLDPDATTWYDVAYVLDEDTEAWVDQESAPGESSWRMRVRRADGATSTWTAEADATVVTPCCGYTVTSNHAPELSLWADDVNPNQSTRRYDFLQNFENVQFDQRDGSVTFFETEDRGVRFEATLILAVPNAKDGTEAADTLALSSFADLLALCRNADIPYVCVREESGDRWFASVLTPRGSKRIGAGLLTADVVVIETTLVPSPVELI